MSSNSSLYSQCFRCQSSLSDILDILRAADRSNADDTLVEDLRGRFRVWADNVGARRVPESTTSLDHRLRNARIMRESIQSGLSRLETLAAASEAALNFHLTDVTDRDNSHGTFQKHNDKPCWTRSGL